MKKNIKKIIWTITAISISFSAFSYDWPLELPKIESIKSFFGQLHGGRISTSLIVEAPQPKKDEEPVPVDVMSCEEGRVLTVIYSINDENDFFPSTLGNAVIIAHEDNIISVYGNLEGNSIPESLVITPSVSENVKIGQIGKSAWQENTNGLDFSIVDSKNKAAINPRILLPRIEKEGTFAPTEIVLEGKEGKRFELSTNRTFQSGTYKFYQRRNDKLVPFKISISVNGDVADEHSFDTVFQEDNKIFVNGKTKKYPGKTIYPDEKLLFIGEAKLTPGKSVLTFENTNHLGDKRLANYNVTIY